MPGLVYQPKLWAFDRDGHFSKKRAVMFEYNLIS